MIDDLLDLEGTDESRRQLGRLHLKWDVPGGEIDLLTHLVCQSKGAMAIGGHSVPVHGAKET